MRRKLLAKVVFGIAIAYLLFASIPTFATGPDLSTGTPIYIYNSGSGGIGVSQVAMGASTAAVSSGLCTLSQVCPVILYQQVNGWWVESARLLPAPSEITSSVQLQTGGPTGTFGVSVAVSSDGNTVFVGDTQAPCAATPNQQCGVIDTYTKPANGWHDMTPTAQITVSASVGEALGGRLLMSGNTLFATGLSSCPTLAGSCAVVFVFTMPAGGWAATTPVATLTTPSSFGFNPGAALAFDATTSTLAACFGASEVYVFQAGASGFSSGAPVAVLASSDYGFGNLIGLGNALSISGNVIAAGGPNSSLRAGSNGGLVLVWIMPPGGWQDMSIETAALSAAVPQQTLALGSGVLVDGNEILASTAEGLLYQYTEPPGGWASMTESSQIPAGVTFGGPLSLSGPFVLQQSTQCAVLNARCGAGFVYGAPAPTIGATALVVQSAVIRNAQSSSSPTPVVLADTPVQATINIQNISQYSANNAVLSIAIPPNTSDYTISTGTCTMAGTMANCSLGSIAPLSTLNVTLTFNPPATRTTFAVTGTVSQDNQSWDLLDNTASFQAISDNPPVTPAVTSVTAYSGHTLTGMLSATDADSDALSFTLMAGPYAGSATLSPAGKYTYVPPPTSDVDGFDTFEYGVSDGLLDAQGTVNITLNPSPVNTVPPPGKSSGGGGLGIITLLALAGTGLSRRRRSHMQR